MDFEAMHPDTLDPRLLLSKPLDLEDMHSHTLDPHLLLPTPMEIGVLDGLIDFQRTDVGSVDFNTMTFGDMDSGMTEPDLTEPGTIDLSTLQFEEVGPDDVEFGFVNSGSMNLGDVDLSENVDAPADCGRSRLDATSFGLFEREATLSLPATSVRMRPGTSTNQRMDWDIVDVDVLHNNSVDVAMTHHGLTGFNRLNFGTKGIDIGGDQQIPSSNQELPPSAASHCDDATNAGHPPPRRSATIPRLTSPKQVSPEGSAVKKNIRSDEWREYKPKCHDESATRARVTADEWQEYQPFLEQLYVVENVRLKDVMQSLETKFGFVATYVTPVHFTFSFIIALLFSLPG
jgi:hypothetical protein